MSEERKPDVIRYPQYLIGGNLFDKVRGAHDRFSNVVGGKGWIFPGMGSMPNHYALDPTMTLLFPEDHPKHNQSRYEWIDQGEGIFYGYLIDGA